MRYLIAIFSISTALAVLSACSSVGSVTVPQPNSAVQKSTTSSYQLLYSFGSNPQDGAGPIAGLINIQGLFYGTTANGGSTTCGTDGCGTVFSLTTSGTEKVLHRFGLGYGDTATHPYAGLLAFDGALYGTTAISGQCNGTYLSCGTVFSLGKYGVYTILHDFVGAPSDGGAPAAPLVALKGVLYGTTFTGGSGTCTTNGNGCGTVFSITPDGTETVLYNFAGSGDGANPESNLVVLNNVLYGTTQTGGTNNQGVVFSITPSGTETVLHSFGGAGDGAQPQAGLVAFHGILYGTTYAGGSGPCTYNGLSGCGTVFKTTATGNEKVLHSFSGSDGAYPLAALVVIKGILYGTTFGGGTGSCSYNGLSGCGTAFSTSRRGTEKVLHYFAGSTDGSGPAAPLLPIKGVYYGTTQLGGAHGAGTVFSVKP